MIQLKQTLAEWKNRINVHIQFLETVANDFDYFFDKSRLPAWIAMYRRLVPLVHKFGAERVWMPVEALWIFHCHVLHPVNYMKDCMDAFGKVVLFNVTADKLNPEFTKKVYREEYGEELSQVTAAAESIFKPSYNLMSAVHAQRVFTREGVLLRNTNYEAHILNYLRFILAIKLSLNNPSERPVAFVPTVEIDLVWHTHQRYPDEYLAWTEEQTGYQLDHEDEEEDRSAMFDETAVFWEKNYGTPYIVEEQQQSAVATAAQDTVMTKKANCCAALEDTKEAMTKKANCCVALQDSEKPMEMTKKANCCVALQDQVPMTKKANCCLIVQESPLLQSVDGNMTKKANCCLVVQESAMTKKANCCLVVQDASDSMTKKANCCLVVQEKAGESATMTKKANCCLVVQESTNMTKKAYCCLVVQNAEPEAMTKKANCCLVVQESNMTKKANCCLVVQDSASVMTKKANCCVALQEQVPMTKKANCCLVVQDASSAMVMTKKANCCLVVQNQIADAPMTKKANCCLVVQDIISASDELMTKKANCCLVIQHESPMTKKANCCLVVQG